MIWDDSGFLLSKNKYSENSLIAEIFTKDHGKISGIIFGGTSKKIKNYLQIGNELYVNYSAKSDNRIGYFKIEILQAFSPIYFENSQKLFCINSSMNLIKILTAESQQNKKLYDLILKFYKIIDDENWLNKYIFWELELFKVLGYDLILEDLVKKEIINQKITYFVQSSTEKKIVPNFLLTKDYSTNDNKILLNGLNLVGDYLEKTILKPNNLNYPISRIHFLNSLKLIG
tara:strand:+ start:2305 stop:2994 length:690 start_codon:yes stop_codon:yes gene_type:complete